MFSMTIRIFFVLLRLGKGVAVLKMHRLRIIVLPGDMAMISRYQEVDPVYVLPIFPEVVLVLVVCTSSSHV